MYRRGTKISLRQALERFESAARAYRSLGDQEGEGRALHSAGQVLSALGKDDESLTRFREALRLRKAVNDLKGQASTLTGMGFAWLGKKDREQALERFREALRCGESAGDPGEQAMAQNGIGAVHEEQGQRPEALAAYRAALALSRTVGERRAEAIARTGIASIFDDLRKQKESLRSYLQAAALGRTLRDRRIEAKALHGMALVISAQGDPKRALGLYRVALRLRREAGDRTGEARTLNNLGNLWSAWGKKSDALSYYRQAEAIYRELGDEGRRARALNNIGSIYSELGDKKKARDYFEEVLPLFQKSADRRNEATTRNNLGFVWLDLGELEKARRQIESAIPIFHDIDDPGGEAQSYGSLGIIAAIRGERQKALEFSEKALSLSRQAHDKSVEANLLNNVATTWYALGQRKTALEKFQQSRAAFLQLNDPAGEAFALNGTGEILQEMKDHAGALACYQRSLRLARAASDPSGEAYALTSLGKLWLERKQGRRALPFYENARSLYRKLGQKLGESDTLNWIGEAYMAQGETAKALGYFEEALSLARSAENQNGEARILKNLMLGLESESPRLAILFGKESVNRYQDLRAGIQGLEKSIQRTYRQSIEATYRSLARILVSQGRFTEAEAVRELLEDEEYFKYIRRGPRTASAPGRRLGLTKKEAEALAEYAKIGDQLTALGTELIELQERKARLSPDEPFPEQARLDELQARLTAAARAMKIFFRQLAETFGPRDERVTEIESTLIADLRNWGDAETVVIAAYPDRKGVSLVVTTPATQKARSMKIAEAELIRLVDEFRAAVTNACACRDPRPAGKKLYDLLVRPLEEDLRGAKAKTLIWLMDGALTSVPVAALWDGQHYLAERFDNAMMIFHNRAKLAVKPKPASDWQVLGAGVSKAWGNFTALPAVPNELAGIIRDTSSRDGATTGLLPGLKLLDDEFTREAFKKYLGRYSVVHIASHFELSGNQDSGPFLLMGDGTPYALEEIASDASMFRGVELLVLSACNTANSVDGEETRGGETKGLGRLAQDQGALAVLATLWAVGDESTARLMREFYRERIARPEISKAAALRRAQLFLLTSDLPVSHPEARRSTKPEGASKQAATPVFKRDPSRPFSHPYYWAPFILIGNWR